MITGSPAWNPQAMLAEVTTWRSCSSSPMRQGPKPSPRLLFTSTRAAIPRRMTRAPGTTKGAGTRPPPHRVRGLVALRPVEVGLRTRELGRQRGVGHSTQHLAHPEAQSVGGGDAHVELRVVAGHRPGRPLLA